MAENKLGQVLEAGIFASHETRERFMKVRAVLDLTKPLRSQILAAIDDNVRFWVSMKYEYLPSFCFKCGRVEHFINECTFDPPAGQEKFGPHMSTKKLGVRVYESEDETQQFRGKSKSVWVNTALGGGADHQMQKQSRAQVDQLGIEALHSDPQERTSPKNGGGRQAQSHRHRSPRGFHVRRSPRARPVRQPSHQSPLKGRVGPRPAEQGGEAGPKRDRGGRFKPQPVSSAAKAKGMVAGRPRKRDLRQEAQSIWVQSSPAPKPRRRLVLADFDAEGEGPVQDPSLADQQGEVVKKNFRRRLIKAVNLPPVGPDDGHGTHSEGAGDDLMDPSSDEDVSQFMITSRAPKEKTPQTIRGMKGRVQQVVAAFESGLHRKPEDDTIRSKGMDPELVQGMKAWEDDGDGHDGGQFNEYGSNLADPDIDSRKRPLGEVEGELGVEPSPKKQFVEDDANQVEVASQKWPQPDK
ncbi:unnamed protein product [Linum trigynum]|uniref:Zinc knuckle CX2CX4HX4C domain-containing protein n=1 Tax=Linum trigynum TaxID=586398 RepID=A0AAV2D8Z8_9ROSI